MKASKMASQVRFGLPTGLAELNYIPETCRSTCTVGMLKIEIQPAAVPTSDEFSITLTTWSSRRVVSSTWLPASSYCRKVSVGSQALAGTSQNTDGPPTSPGLQVKITARLLPLSGV